MTRACQSVLGGDLTSLLCSTSVLQLLLLLLALAALMNRGVCVSCTWNGLLKRVKTTTATMTMTTIASFAKLINTEIKLLACQLSQQSRPQPQCETQSEAQLKSHKGTRRRTASCQLKTLNCNCSNASYLILLLKIKLSTNPGTGNTFCQLKIKASSSSHWINQTVKKTHSKHSINMHKNMRQVRLWATWS